MSEWYVKELSNLTKISVQTLHHYDRIGLLNPSLRLANGYRLYSEKDLSKLQQIIALKYFGFDLSQIKNFLSKEVDMIENFSIQSQLLEEKAKTLFEASQTLKNMIGSLSCDKSISWETIIKSIEVYRMTQQLEKTWAGKVLTPNELNDYAKFEQELSSRFSESEIQTLREKWHDIAKDVHHNLNKDPNSDFGIALGKRCMDWVNTYYGKKYITLRNAIWEKGLKKGQGDGEGVLSLDGSLWLDNAISAYYENRIQHILQQGETAPQQVLSKQWEELLTDMYGDDKEAKTRFLSDLLLDNKITPSIKKCLRQVKKSCQ